MARIIDDRAHAKRRNAFLDTAQRLIETKGYERMTIQDVLDDLGTSKGSLYHYFDSKQALLEGLVVRLVDGIQAHLARAVNDPAVSTLDKLRQFFAALVRFRSEQKQLLLAMLRVWFSDENAIVRQKLRLNMTDQIAPLLGQIVEQGIDERVLAARNAEAARDAEQVGRVAVGLLHDLDDALSRLLLASDAGGTDWRFIERTVAAYTDALESVLGAPSGSLVLIDTAELQAWFDLARNDRDHDSDPDSKGEQQWHRAVV